MPQPIAANLNGASTILAEAFPASFITFDPLVFYRLDYIKKTERLLGNDIWNQVMVLNACDRNAH